MKSSEARGEGCQAVRGEGGLSKADRESAVRVNVESRDVDGEEG